MKGVLLCHCKKIFVVLTIASSSELQPIDMDLCIATTVLLLQYCCYNINKSSSNVIYGYNLTGKWTGTPSSGINGLWNGQWDVQLVAPLCFRLFPP